MKYLISIYAGMQQLQFLIKSKEVPLDAEIDLSSIPLPILPITSTASSNMSTWDGSAQSRVIVDNTTLADAPLYVSPVLDGRVKFVDYVSGFLHLDADPGVLEVQAISPVSPVLDLVTIDSSGWVQPTFIAPIFDNPDWSNTDNWIEIEEDPEMLAARVQEISAKAAEFSSLLQEAKMRFDKDNIIFQSQIQESLQNAQLAGSKEGQEIQKFSTEQSDYQAKVNAEIGEYTQKLSRYSTEMQTALTAWSKEESDKVSRFAAELQNSLNEFNEDNAEYSAKLQIALENARLSSAADGILMQRYASDLQSYQARVASKIQEYTAKVQARTLEYQWLQEQHARLQNQYEKGFVPFQPPKEKD
jgi:phage gp36-like protein